MLVLLPPSEGKHVPTRGAPLRPERWPAGLGEPRRRVLDALVTLCRDEPERAARVLGLGPSQAEEVRRNAALPIARTARADRVYTGVLYEALDLASLPDVARRRATRRLAVTSSLYGLVRLDEPVAAYRLAGGVTLPGLGPVAAHWRRHLDPVVRERAGSGLVVDLRSSTYASFWRPGPDLARRTATVRVLHESGGRRTVVSHVNKATKGRLVRDLLLDGSAPGTVGALAGLLATLGWAVEADGTRLDVVVTQV